MEISDIRNKQSFTAGYFKCNGVWYRVADGGKIPNYNMSKTFNRAKSKAILKVDSSDMFLHYGYGQSERCGIIGLPFVFTGKEARRLAKLKTDEVCTFFNDVFKSEFLFKNLSSKPVEDSKFLLKTSTNLH